MPIEEEFGGSEDADATTVFGTDRLDAEEESSDADVTVVFGNAAASSSDDDDRYNMPIGRQLSEPDAQCCADDTDATIVFEEQAKNSAEREAVAPTAFDDAGDTDATVVFGNAAASSSDDGDRYNMPIGRTSSEPDERYYADDADATVVFGDAAASSSDDGDRYNMPIGRTSSEPDEQYYADDTDATIVLVHEEDECDTMVFGVSTSAQTPQPKDESPVVEDSDDTIVFAKHVIGTPVEGGGISVKYGKQPVPDVDSEPVTTRVVEPDDDATCVLGGEPDYDDDSTTVLTGPEEMPEPKEIVVYYLIRQSSDERFDLAMPAIVGKGSAATVRIPGNTAISRAHLEVRLDGETVKAKDLDTTNGSYVGGNQLEPGVEVELNDQDIVKLADETFVFCVETRMA